MRRIDRPWLRRIPDYVPGAGPPRPGYRKDEGGEKGAAADPDGEEALLDEEGEESPAAEEAGAEEAGGGEAAQSEEERDGEDAGPESETAEQSAEADPGGEPGEPTGEGADPELDTSLYLPQEIEEARDAEERGKGARNPHRAPRAFPLEGRYMRGLAARFARVVAKLAEDNADLPQEGDEEWDLNALVRRRFTGRLPHHCRMSREKRKVVVVLDTSPSCAHQARLFGALAQIAEELGDCEMFDAPNFSLTSLWRTGAWEDLPAEEREWQFRNRVVLAFGDFDGIEHICAASQRRGNRIYWFCCEERPAVLESNRETFVHGYKGHYFPATHLKSLMRQMARVR